MTAEEHIRKRAHEAEVIVSERLKREVGITDEEADKSFIIIDKEAVKLHNRNCVICKKEKMLGAPERWVFSNIRNKWVEFIDRLSK